MAYQRVLPRDLFNEANLLNCLGKLIIMSGETPDLPFELEVREMKEGQPFLIEQDQAGNICATNVRVYINSVKLELVVCSNNRRKFPLELVLEDMSSVYVFGEDGTFDSEFLEEVSKK